MRDLAEGAAEMSVGVNGEESSLLMISAGKHCGNCSWSFACSNPFIVCFLTMHLRHLRKNPSLFAPLQTCLLWWWLLLSPRRRLQLQAAAITATTPTTTNTTVESAPGQRRPFSPPGKSPQRVSWLINGRIPEWPLLKHQFPHTLFSYAFLQHSEHKGVPHQYAFHIIRPLDATSYADLFKSRGFLSCG